MNPMTLWLERESDLTTLGIDDITESFPVCTLHFLVRINEDGTLTWSEGVANDALRQDSP